MAAGDSGQGGVDVGRQPAGGFVADDDFSDVEPGGRRDHGVDDGGHGICAAGGEAGGELGWEGGADGGGGGAAEVFAGVHEPAGQGGGVPSVEGGAVGGDPGDRVGDGAAEGAGHGEGAIFISGDGGGG